MARSEVRWEALANTADERSAKPVKRSLIPQTTVRYVHVRRDLVDSHAPLGDILEDINQMVRERGAVVLADGQFLRAEVSLDWDLEAYFSDDTTTPFQHHRRTWGNAQAQYFAGLWCIPDPYQYPEASKLYDLYCVAVRVPESYLEPSERILALADAQQDDAHLYCPCHCAEIVYTSARRLICLGCGQLHAALQQHISRDWGEGLTWLEWEAAFDESGEFVDGKVQLPIVDYREIVGTGLIWSTDAWSEATWLIEFYATATPEEIARYEAGLPTAEDFIEAGGAEVPSPPPLAAQINEAIEYDLTQNAAAALNAGVVAFTRGRTDVGFLREAVLNVFQAMELVLKMRLDAVDPAVLGRRPDNPSVLKALAAAGVQIDSDDLESIGRLRELRNRLQHHGARFSYRDTRALIRQVFVFVDAFCLQHLGLWIGDAIDTPCWQTLLALASIRSNAERIALARVAELRGATGFLVSLCPNCEQETFVRRTNGGSECLFCRYHPGVMSTHSD